MSKTIIIILFLIVLIAGCLETKDSWPATIGESTLKEAGWAGAGAVQKQSQTQNVAGTTIKINTAVMNYRDDVLAMNITRQLQKLSGITQEQASDASQFTSQLITMRLVLPGGISLPSEMMNKIIASQLEQMASQNKIRDFHKTGTSKIMLAGGKETNVANYEGYIDFEGGSIKIRGIMAAWPDSGSNIIVFGVTHWEDIVITPRQGKPVSVVIDGEQESTKIIKLIRNVN
ncbi:MAG: DUF6517 family protein [Candidatus Methanoperedens sp.]|nr:DUF6517 family protein [Candidatus Methanoperedens sp.]